MWCVLPCVIWNTFVHDLRSGISARSAWSQKWRQSPPKVAYRFHMRQVVIKKKKTHHWRKRFQKGMHRHTDANPQSHSRSSLCRGGSSSWQVCDTKSLWLWRGRSTDVSVCTNKESDDWFHLSVDPLWVWHSYTHLCLPLLLFCHSPQMLFGAQYNYLFLRLQDRCDSTCYMKRNPRGQVPQDSKVVCSDVIERCTLVGQSFFCFFF